MSKSRTSSFFQRLPKDLNDLILSYSAANDLAKLMTTSKSQAIMSSNAKYWYKHLKNIFSYEYRLSPGAHPFEIYQSRALEVLAAKELLAKQNEAAAAINTINYLHSDALSCTTEPFQLVTLFFMLFNFIIGLNRQTVVSYFHALSEASLQDVLNPIVEPFITILTELKILIALVTQFYFSSNTAVMLEFRDSVTNNGSTSELLSMFKARQEITRSPKSTLQIVRDFQIDTALAY